MFQGVPGILYLPELLLCADDPATSRWRENVITPSCSTVRRMRADSSLCGRTSKNIKKISMFSHNWLKCGAGSFFAGWIYLRMIILTPPPNTFLKEQKVLSSCHHVITHECLRASTSFCLKGLYHEKSTF